ncbi:MAG: hypothetical protein JEZ04_11100 [Spirochaetales bacterium]|nr:hypothetical protein [Spirochaetales bacterium]
MTVKKLIIILNLIIIPQLLTAFSLEGIQFNTGNAIILNAEDVSISPAPTQSAALLGVSVPMMFTDILYFEPGIRLYAFNVILEATKYKPVPAAVETRDRVSVLGCEIRPEIGAVFKISESIELGVTGAPVVLLRFPIQANDDAGDEEKTTILNYYFSSLRFLSFYTGGFFTWNFSENIALKLKIGTDIPIYHIWDGEVIAFYDQMIIVPELCFFWRF